MIWLLVIVIVVLLAVVAALVMRQRRTTQLREGFGPEYDRAVDEHGDQRSAEAELRERQQRRREYDIRPLEPAAQERYAKRWQAAQARFVDEPGAALNDADTLVGEVMRDRGYPVEDFDRQAADVSVDHPEVVEHYREAHAIHTRDGETSTEHLRQAMVHYRALFAELLEPTDHESQSTRPTRVEEEVR